jgi:hypothetical protein
LVWADEFHRNPDEENTTNGLQKRHTEKMGNNNDKKEPKNNRPCGSKDPPEKLITRWKRPNSKSNHHRIVTGKRKIKEDDPDESHPKVRSK